MARHITAVITEREAKLTNLFRTIDSDQNYDKAMRFAESYLRLLKKTEGAKPTYESTLSFIDCDAASGDAQPGDHPRPGF